MTPPAHATSLNRSSFDVLEQSLLQLKNGVVQLKVSTTRSCVKSFCPQCFITIEDVSCARCPQCNGPSLPSGGWPMDDWLGKTVDGGKYCVTALLGVGGFGRVYEVQHQLITGRTLAMKVLDMRHAGARVREEQFIQEIQLLMQLNHPNVVACHEAGWLENGALFVLMEKIEGDELSVILKRQKRPMTPAEAIQIGLQTARALSAAHSHGVLHRDLKPENIMLTKKGEVRVVDFGIAKILGPDTVGQELSRVVGTPLYMAPEQFNSGERIDGRLDIYQLGAVLHFVLTGRPPFVPDTGNNFAALLHIARGQKSCTGKGGPRPSEHRPELRATQPAQKLDTLVSQMLSFEPELRPNSAEDVIRLLEECSSISTPASRSAPLLVVSGEEPPNSAVSRASTVSLGKAQGEAMGAALRASSDKPSTPPPARKVGRRTVVEHASEQFSPEVQEHIKAYQAAASVAPTPETPALTVHEHQRIPTFADPATPLTTTPPSLGTTIPIPPTPKTSKKTLFIISGLLVGFVLLLLLGSLGVWAILASSKESAYKDAEAYYYGKGVEKDPERAYPLYSKACGKDLSQACLQAGRMAARGHGIERDDEVAFEFFERACSYKDHEGCFEQARAYARGRGTEKNFTKAVEAYESACDANYVRACTYLGLLCERDTTGTWNKRDYRALYHQACEEGDSHGCYRYANLYEKGAVVTQDFSKAAHHYGESCKGGYPLGCVARGSLYSRGKGSEKNAQKALKFYIKGCDGREASGCHNASVMYKKGRGTAVDPMQVEKYTKLACSYGRKKSCAE